MKTGYSEGAAEVPQMEAVDAALAALAALRAEAAAPAEALRPYQVFVLYDEETELDWEDHAALADAAGDLDPSRPLLIILCSRGGLFGPTMAFARLARARSAGPLEIAAPSTALSCATLLCCAADRLHLGPGSALSPIDPRHDAIPALALPHALSALARTVAEHPSCEGLVRELLRQKLDLVALGKAERSLHGVEQMAVRLLDGRAVKRAPGENAATATRLVRGYPDHDHVIDATEATGLFGADVVTNDSPVLRAASVVLKLIQRTQALAGAAGLHFPPYVGLWSPALVGFGSLG